MISKSRVKFIKSLHLKKFRDKEGLFIAEGVKVVDELLASDMETHHVFATRKWLASRDVDAVEITEAELKQISLLESPNQVLALGCMPAFDTERDFRPGGLVLVIDNVRDPGNLGAILRTADWFGLRRVLCLPGTVDAFNPKTVQASMGSVFRVACLPAAAPEAAALLKKAGYLVCAAVTEGDPAAALRFPDKTAIVVGSESTGIQNALLQAADRKIAVPGKRSGGPDSLNVSVAAAILCYAYFENR